MKRYCRLCLRCFIDGTYLHLNCQKYVIVQTFVGNVNRNPVHSIICGCVLTWLNLTCQWLQISLKKITGQKIKSDPYLHLLTIVDSSNYSSLMIPILSHVIVIAIILYSKYWNSPNVPTEICYYKKYMNVLKWICLV